MTLYNTTPQGNTKIDPKNPCQDHPQLKEDLKNIFTAYENLRKESKHRDEKLLYAFNQNTKEIEQLRNDLDKRKLINNFNEKEKEWLRNRIEGIGGKAEKTDMDIYAQVKDHDTRLSKIEGRSKLIFFIIPLLFTVILAVQAINLYWLLQHIAQ
jgi:hypothetical protein